MNHSPDDIQVVLGDHARFQVDPGEITMPVTEIFMVTKTHSSQTNHIDLTFDVLLFVFVIMSVKRHV